MLACIEKVENRYIARFERHLKHPAEEVWSWLTENGKLKQWFPELQVGELGEGGYMRFTMPDGAGEQLAITGFERYAVLEFSWWDCSIRFELTPESDGCLLVMKERITSITEHTPKDLAGWHVCLDVIALLLDGKTMDSRMKVWKTWYEQYVRAVESISANGNKR